MSGDTGRTAVTTNGAARRAVVIGASMAGMCAARVLADRFDQVVVLDRDRLPTGPEARGQVPQGRHPHLLLVAGARLLEGWFPGIGDELIARGAVEIDLCADFLWHQAGGTARRPTSGLRGPVMSRPLLEATVRARLESLPNVTVRDSIAVDGLEVTGERISGVRLADGATIAADLIIDATGRRARSLDWLAELGYEPPPTTTVEVDTRYVSRAYRRTNDPARDWLAAAVIDEPAARRLAMALPIEGDRWLVLVGGLNGEAPPIEEADRVAYVAGMPSPVIAEIMANSEPAGDVATHRFPANQRRHLTKLRRFPLGWLPIGDAVASFDPIYGQGMTSAAQQAAALADCLGPSLTLDRQFSARYFKAADRIVAVPWSIAVGGDFAYPGTTGPKPAGTDLVNRYMERVTRAGQRDDAVAIRFNEVAALVRPPGSLLTPTFILRVLRASRRNRRAAAGKFGSSRR